MKITRNTRLSKCIALLLSLCLLAGMMPAAVFAEAPKVTIGDVYRTKRTEAVVEFTSDTAGAYYTVTKPSGFTGDVSIDTTGSGTPCPAGVTVSVTVSGITTEPCLLFLVVKGGDGTESEVMCVEIPEWDWWLLDDAWILHIESDKGLTYWNNWLDTLDSFTKMRYQMYVQGVKIRKDVTNIDGSSFPATDYPNLAAYTVEEGSESYSVEDGVLYNSSKTWLLAYPGAKTDTDFTVPDSVISISGKAFYGNTKLKNITVNKVNIVSQAFAGSAIETFFANEMTRIADWAFYNCQQLTTVTVKGGEGFEVAMYAFQNCKSLTSFPFGKISKSGSYAFQGCSSLTEIRTPNYVGNYMFIGCTGLTEVTFPATVTVADLGAFDGCTNLHSVTFESATPPGFLFASGFTPTQSDFRIHVPKGSENAYIAKLGEGSAPYILDSSTMFYPLYVNGERFRSDKLTIACGDGTAKFDPDTNILTLTNVEITEYGGKYGYRGAVNSGLSNLTIVLVGDNTIDTEGDSINTGMNCNLVITGDGTLTTNSQLDLGREPSLAYDGSSDIGNLTIDGATVTVGSYLFVHHDITFTNGAAVNVSGKITGNHQSTVTVDEADTFVTADALAMGNGSNSDQTECRLVLNDGTLVLRDSVSFPNPEDGDTSSYAIHFDPRDLGKIILNGGTFQTLSDCQVTNAPVENITVGSEMKIKSGSWKDGKLLISEYDEAAGVAPAVGSSEPTVSKDIASGDQATAGRIAGSVGAADAVLEAAAESAATELNQSSPAEKGQLVKKGQEELTPSDEQAISLYTQTYLKVEATTLTKDDGDAITSITLDITPMVRIIASTAESAQEIKLDGESINAVVVREPKPLQVQTSAQITVKLPESFGGQTVYVKHEAGDEKVYFYRGDADEDGSLTFTSRHGFSPFTFSMENGAAVEIDEIGYENLQDAVNDAKDNDTIVIRKTDGSKLPAKVSGTSRTITIQNGTEEEITVTLNGKDFTIQPGESVEYTYRSSHTSHSGSSSGSSASPLPLAPGASYQPPEPGEPAQPGESGEPAQSGGNPGSFRSDTTSDFTVSGPYQFRITSLDGTVPVMTADNSSFRVEFASQEGSDYFFRIVPQGAAGSTAKISVNGASLLTATVGGGDSAVVSDTTHPFTVAQGGTYQFRLTASARPGFTAGSASFTVEYAGQSGSDYFYKVHAVGQPGDGCGFYVNGEASPVAVATIA